MICRGRSGRVFAVIAVILAYGPMAVGQTLWDGSDSNLWRIPGNWSAGVPTSTTDADVGAPSPTVIDGAATVLNLDVLPAGKIEILGVALSGLTIIGDLDNDGLIVVNSNNGTSGASLHMTGGGAIDGSGAIVLGSTTNSARITSDGTITHGADHAIRGEGQLLATFVNNGTITAMEANGDSTATLTITTPAGGGGSAGPFRTNNGVIRSSSSAEIDIAARINQGATGRMIADGGTIRLNNSTINGGTLESAGGGVFDTTGNSLKLSSVHVLGQINMISVSGGTVPTMVIEGGGITNDGTIVVQANAAPGGGSILFSIAGVIGGSGEIILNREGSGARFTGGVQGTNGEDHTIRGVGTIESPFVNDGTIIAEPRGGGTVLSLANAAMTNNNVVRADAGGVLRLAAVSVTQDDENGRIVANEGVVELHANSFNSVLVTGGRFETVGAGTIEVAFNTRIDDVTNEGVFNIQPSRQLSMGGSSYTNNGTTTLQNSAGPSFNAASLIFVNNVTLDGDGEIVFADTVSPVAINRIAVNAGFTVTHAAGHLIRGEGQINGPGMLVNNGRIEGTSPARFFEINAPLGGSGLLKNVRIDATHSPGAGTAIVPLEGAYTVNSFGGRLNMEIGGTTPGSGYDQLSSTDPTNVITIGATQTTLDVSLTNGFIPAHGDTFTLVQTVGTINGQFDDVNLPGLPPGFFWMNVSTPQSIAYRAIAALAGDFEEDNDVDNADLAKWRMGFGTPTGATHMSGDADKDGDVDGTDFLIWQLQRGTGVLVAPSSEAVPEPAAWVLLLGLGVGLAAACRARA